VEWIQLAEDMTRPSSGYGEFNEVFLGDQPECDDSEGLGVNGRIILKRILEKRL
jgi:hypothetical protein